MFELPESLGELSVADLNDLLAAARTEAQAALAADAADLDRLEVLADAIDALSTEISARSDADALATATTERAAALAARLATEEVEVEEELADDTEVDEEVVEPVVASIKAPAKKVVAPKVTLPKKDAMKNSALVAAANLSGTSAGTGFESLADVVPHMLRAWDGLKGASNGSKNDVFSVRENMDERLVANGRNDQEVVAYAVNQARLGDGAGLLAAGGWCAPAEQRYDICNLASLSGLLDLPSISVPRGSISYFRDLRYNDVAAAALAGIGDFTNAELLVLPPVVKPCVEVPCVTPVTFTLDVVSFCVRAGVLQNRAFPELVEAWLSQALIAYQRYLNARRIAQIVALAAVNTVVIPGSFGALAPFLAALELQAMDLRYDHGMGENEVVEGFAPFWLPAVFRADASRRAFGNDYNLTTAQINSYLASRNIRLQWVKDYVDAPFAGVAPVTAWPGTVNVVLYPAGAYLNAADPILRVGALQDTTLLTTNREQLLFVETAEGIVPACGDGRVVTISICPNGEAGALVAPTGSGACPIA